MSMYNIKRFVSDFADRTLENLEAIEELSEDKNNGVFEITQRLNSLFGLLILPFERFYSNRAWNDVVHKPSAKQLLEFFIGIQEEERLAATYPDVFDRRTEELRIEGILHHMRNALAHSGKRGVRVLPCGQKNISEIIFFDTDPKEETFKFCIKITIDELNTLIRLLASFFKVLELKASETEHPDDIYEREVIECEDFLSKFA